MGQTDKEKGGKSVETVANLKLSLSFRLNLSEVLNDSWKSENKDWMLGKKKKSKSHSLQNFQSKNCKILRVRNTAEAVLI